MLLHGFLRTGASMALLGVRLKALGYRAIHLPTFGYHLGSLEAHGAALRRRLLTLTTDDVDYDVVTFSFGGVLLRVALADDPTPLPRRVVMLSPPSQGALLAQQVRAQFPVHHLGWDPLAPLLPGEPSRYPMPPTDVGILTGGTGKERGLNPWLPGDNDGEVRVAEARQPGVAFKVIPQWHFQMPFSDLAFRETRAFLETGRFLEP